MPYKPLSTRNQQKLLSKRNNQIICIRKITLGHYQIRALFLSTTSRIVAGNKAYLAEGFLEQAFKTEALGLGLGVSRGHMALLISVIPVTLKSEKRIRGH